MQSMHDGQFFLSLSACPSSRMTFSRLPVEIVLRILQELDWDERLSFGSVEPYTRMCSLQLRTDKVFKLQYPVNTLRLACSQHIQLPEQQINLGLLRLTIMYAYAATKYTILQPSSTSQKFTKWFCKELAKRPNRGSRYIHPMGRVVVLP